MSLPLPNLVVTSFQTYTSGPNKGQNRTGSHAPTSDAKAFDVQPVNFRDDYIYFGTAIILNHLLPDGWTFLFYLDDKSDIDKAQRHFHIQKGGTYGYEWTENGERFWRPVGRILQKEKIKGRFGYFRNASFPENHDPFKTDWIKSRIPKAELDTLENQINALVTGLGSSYDKSIYSKLPSVQKSLDLVSVAALAAAVFFFSHKKN